jgi:hypothetical protein
MLSLKIFFQPAQSRLRSPDLLSLPALNFGQFTHAKVQECAVFTLNVPSLIYSVGIVLSAHEWSLEFLFNYPQPQPIGFDMKSNKEGAIMNISEAILKT